MTFWPLESAYYRGLKAELKASSRQLERILGKGLGGSNPPPSRGL